MSNSDKLRKLTDRLKNVGNIKLGPEDNGTIQAILGPNAHFTSEGSIEIKNVDPSLSREAIADACKKVLAAKVKRSLLP